MSITMNELEEALESILDYESWDNQIGALSKALEHQYSKGVQEGLRLAALYTSGGLVSPNSFAASRAKDDNVDNSDDLYVNA